MMCLNSEIWSLQLLSFNIHIMVATIESSFYSNDIVVLADRYVKWNNNYYECTILNVDGSCHVPPTRFGFEAVLQNGVGFFLSGFSGYILGSTNIMHDELLVIYHGPTLAKDKGIDELVCYSDSLACINLIILVLS